MTAPPAAPAAGGRGVLLALGAALCFATMGLLVHLGRDIPPAELAFTRGLVAMLALLPLVRGQLRVLLRREAAWLWLRSAAGGISALCYFWTLQHTGVATARALADLAPGFVVLLAIVLGREAPSGAQLAAIAVMLCAAVLLDLNSTVPVDGFTFTVGVLGAASAGVALHALRQSALRFKNPLIVFSMALAMSLGALLFPGPDWVAPDARGWALLLGVGGIGLLGQLLMTAAYLRLEAPVASALLITGLVWSVGYDLVLGRMPGPLAWTAYAAIVVGAGVLHALERRRHEAVVRLGR